MDSVHAFVATVDGRPVEGLLRERLDAEGMLISVSLFLRPYRNLQRAIELMRGLLAADPLPEAPA